MEGTSERERHKETEHAWRTLFYVFPCDVHVSGDVFNLPPKHTNERWKGILIGNAGSVRFCCTVAINLWKDQPGGGEEIDVATS